jgi:protein O-mannosyl-transferase
MLSLPQTRRHLWAVVLLAALVGFTFYTSFPATFVYDDVAQVLRSERVQQCRLGEILRTPYWPEAGRALFRPLTLASFCPVPAALRASASAHRLINVLIHLATVLLLYLAIAGRAAARRRWPPAAAVLIAALFAVHPALSEAVNALVGRAELLVGFFTALALFEILRARPDGRRLPPLWLSLPLIWSLALLSKENGVVLPLLLFAVALFLEGWAKLRRNWPTIAAMAIPFVLILVWRMNVLDRPVPSSPEQVVVHGLHQHLAVAGQILGLALAKLVWPWPLQWDYSAVALQPARSLVEFYPFLGWLSLLAAAVAAIALRQWRWLLLPFMWVGALFTSLHIFPLDVIFAERFLYLPFLALALSSGLLLVGRPAPAAAAPRPIGRAALLAGLIVVLASSLQTRWANRLWRDNLLFWEYTVQVAPKSINANINLAYVYDDLGRLSEAEARMRFVATLVKESPNAYGAHGALGQLLLKEGRYAEAREEMEKYLAWAPGAAAQTHSLGKACLALQDGLAARAAFFKAAAMKPDNFVYQTDALGITLHLGDTAAARQAIERLPALRPDWRAELERQAAAWTPAMRQQLQRLLPTAEPGR